MRFTRNSARSRHVIYFGSIFGARRINSTFWAGIAGRGNGTNSWLRRLRNPTQIDIHSHESAFANVEYQKPRMAGIHNRNPEWRDSAYKPYQFQFSSVGSVVRYKDYAARLHAMKPSCNCYKAGVGPDLAEKCQILIRLTIEKL